MSEGALPPGYTVKKRRLVKLEKSALTGVLVAVDDTGAGKKKKNKKQKKAKRAKVTLAA